MEAATSNPTFQAHRYQSRLTRRTRHDAVARLHRACDGPRYFDRSLSSWSRSHGSPPGGSTLRTARTAHSQPPQTVPASGDAPDELALICTSAVRLDRDLESRVFQVTIDDSEQITGQIIGGHGERAELGGREPRDRSEWHAY